MGVRYLNNSYKLHALVISSILFIPTTVAFLLYRVIPIQNVNALSIVSVTASINAIIWFIVIIQIFINYFLSRKYPFTLIINLNLFSIFLSVIMVRILTKALSLKGTPLPGGDIRGDLLVIVRLSKIAENEFWSGGNYPPLWPSLIGNAARILDVQGLSIIKPAEFIVLMLSPIFVFYTWRLIIGSWMALIVSIYLFLGFNFDYKGLALNLVIPFFILFIIKISSLSSKKYFNFFYLGIAFGITSLIYYGYLYWLIPMLIVLMLMAFMSPRRLDIFKPQTFLFIGIGVGLWPVISDRIALSNLTFFTVVTILLIAIYLTQNYKKIHTILLYGINAGLLLGLLGSFFVLRQEDTWVEGGVERNNPTINSILNLEGINLLLFFLLLCGVYYLIKSEHNMVLVSSLAGIYLSATIFMYFIASQMQVTLRVDLWPRAKEVQGYSLGLLFLIIFLFVINNLIKENVLKKYLELSNKQFFYLICFVLFITGSYLVSALGSGVHGNMPYHAFTPAWFAHQGCSNPHEDPMLSKVFESNPEIQTFLRVNCPSANWPEILPSN